ncbi:MAG: HNH endonuclease [Lachnospiraceae bacterium]|nr:HNH endonuclease [Lachnospiraceae bacterium]
MIRSGAILQNILLPIFKDLCALGHSANANKIWDIKQMEADHVTAWSKGGSTDISNCEMLCINHNRAKGNK